MESMSTDYEISTERSIVNQRLKFVHDYLLGGKIFITHGLPAPVWPLPLSQ